jgi:hypothetical protein
MGRIFTLIYGVRAPGRSVEEAVMTDTSIARASFNLALTAVGWGAVGLGTAGLFVPGLPTTVFVLIAFYCFPGVRRALRGGFWSTVGWGRRSGGT